MIAGEALVEARDSPPSSLFILPQDGIVLFPDLVVPVALKGSLARQTVEQAGAQTDYLGVVLARTGRERDAYDAEDMHDVGCAAKIMRKLNMPDDSVTVVLRGLRRFRIARFLRTRPYLIARVEYPDETGALTDEAQAMLRLLRGLVNKLLASDDSVPDEFKVAAANIESPRGLADFASTYFVRDPKNRQELLAAFDVRTRLEHVVTILTREVGLVELGQRIQQQIREKLEKQQRDFLLREQMKQIRQELGEAKDEKEVAIQRLEERLAESVLPEDVKKRVGEEMGRLKLLPLESPETGVIRNYLEWIAALPWSRATEDRRDLGAAEKLLRDSHWALDEVKERVLEFLAVRQLKPDHRGPILCFVGPPGVGKTSLGRAIADSLGRKFLRISLGGIRDEAEIRGHRRTYVGAMPGRILQSLKTAGSNNPVFMLDELDKVGTDFRGDPTAALLEALDPEQNSRFSDHFLELPFDLSRVMFVATANTLATIPPALLDRLEVIELPGYTAREKIEIANRYLLPRQIERHGLKPRAVALTRPALRELLHGYTREAGVRILEQMLARVCRKHATRTARGRARRIKVEPRHLKEYLGTPRYQEDKALRPDRPGIAVGLSWTPVGGEALSIEASQVPGKGQLTLTGMMGEVMLESARIALSHVRACAAAYGFAEPNLGNSDIHIHVPAGAVPKDGPSAGITMATALVSLFRRRPTRARLAMTGELTLTGKVLPIGGLRDKVLAARRAGMKAVVLPAANQAQIEELKDDARKGLEFLFVSDFREVVEIAFARTARRARARRTRT
ncbi:MAG: endopeptidase La [Planctomycetes bacterium]|nr:endopeptidase La [Planctomycetota bacterium]